jgi:hypothetical protein
MNGTKRERALDGSLPAAIFDSSARVLTIWGWIAVPNRALGDGKPASKTGFDQPGAGPPADTSGNPFNNVLFTGEFLL